MKTAPATYDGRNPRALAAGGELPDAAWQLHPEEPAAEEELVMHLERDQFVAETSRPVPRAKLSPRGIAALWALRLFAVVVSVMVVYTFIAQLS